jgi:hypothetical protein
VMIPLCADSGDSGCSRPPVSRVGHVRHLDAIPPERATTHCADHHADHARRLGLRLGCRRTSPCAAGRCQLVRCTLTRWSVGPSTIRSRGCVRIASGAARSASMTSGIGRRRILMPRMFLTACSIGLFVERSTRCASSLSSVARGAGSFASGVWPMSDVLAVRLREIASPIAVEVYPQPGRWYAA